MIFSDSHGDVDRMQLALHRQPTRPLAVFHLGDGFRDTKYLDLNGIPLYAVRGNCDLFYGGERDECPDEQITVIGEHRALLTHGARYSVKSGLGNLIDAAVKKRADIVLYGHTHVPDLQVFPAGTTVCGCLLSKPLYLFNPGSIGQRGCFGTLTVQGESVLFGHGSCS